ncbi:MAG TPA: hypothetical protein VG675_13250 [Bryobacteraceae bacterium]|nr:hypothetical protein [Bryobacteraceae bacterium]
MSRLLLILLSSAAAFAQPQINYRGVVNAASYMAPGLPGGSIALGSMFSIFGKGLGPSSTPALAFPLQTTLAGVSITVSQGSTTVSAIPVFLSAIQINAIMPSNAPLGKVTLRVTYNGAKSNAATVQVAASSFGMFTANSAGMGPGIIQNYLSATETPVNQLQLPAKHGQTEILWGTGLGPVSFPDNVAPTAGNVTQAAVFVGGVPAQVTYSGRTPCCSAIDQIAFVVPPNAPSGCWVPVIVQAGNVASNAGTMAISDSGNCSEPSNALAQGLISGGNVASFLAARISVHEDIGVIKAGDVSADLVGGYLASEVRGGINFNPMFSLPPAGSCTAYTVNGWFPDDVSILPGMAPTGRLLDAGAPSLTGSGGTSNLVTPADLGGMAFGYLGGALSAVPALANKGYLNPGTYTLSAPGGKDIGSFQVSATVPSPLNWTNRDQLTSIDRTKPLTVNWSNAASGSTVFIVGGGVDLPTNSTAFFLCVAPPGASSFTVPPVVLSNIPASRARRLQSPAALYVGEWSFGSPANIPANGVNFGSFTTAVVGGRTVTFQ